MRPLPDYPDSFGAHRASVFPHKGPASYTQVTYGPVAAGDVVYATEAGFKVLDYVVGGITDSGNFRVMAIPITPSGPSTGLGQPYPSYRLQWWANRTAAVGGQAQTVNTEAVATTDLSGETVRLFALGNK